MVNATQSRVDWLKSLQSELESRSAEFQKAVFLRWNDLMIPDRTSFDATYFLNQTALAALFINEGPIEFDADQKAFFKYDANTGVWRSIADAEVRLDLLSFLVPFVWKYPGYVKTDKRLLDSLIQSAEALAFRVAPNRSRCVLHVANGMLHIDGKGKNHQLHPFSTAYSSRNRVPVDFDKSKTYPPKFVAFLESAMTDEDIELLQNWCGMALLGENPFHKILLLSGEAGTGKSQLVDLIEAIIGPENVGTLVADRLEDRFELSGFLGKTLLVGKDVKETFLRSKAVHIVKSLSGDRGIKVELKHSNRRATLEGPFNILISSNADLLVQLQGDAGAWARRLLIIPFDRKAMLDARERESPRIISDYGQQLFKEEGAAILNWMLKGAWRINQAKLKHEPFPLQPTQEQRTRDLLAASDPIKKFIDLNLEVSPGGKLSTVEIFERYLDFCDDKVIDALDSTTFARRIKRPMFECLKSKHGGILDAEGKRARGYRDVKFK